MQDIRGETMKKNQQKDKGLTITALESDGTLHIFKCPNVSKFAAAEDLERLVSDQLGHSNFDWLIMATDLSGRLEIHRKTIRTEIGEG